MFITSYNLGSFVFFQQVVPFLHKGGHHHHSSSLERPSVQAVPGLLQEMWKVPVEIHSVGKFKVDDSEIHFLKHRDENIYRPTLRKVLFHIFPYFY